MLERWLTFLDETTPPEVIEEIQKMDTAIQKTAEKLEFVSKDKEALRMYHMREMGLSDLTTAVNTAIEKEKLKTAKKALQKGSSLDFIQEITGLSIEQIKKL